MPTAGARHHIIRKRETQNHTTLDTREGYWTHTKLQSRARSGTGEQRKNKNREIKIARGTIKTKNAEMNTQPPVQEGKNRNRKSTKESVLEKENREQNKREDKMPNKKEITFRVRGDTRSR